MTTNLNLTEAEIMDKCREAFEKQIRDMFASENGRADLLLKKNDKDEYIIHDVRVGLKSWVMAWNASHDRCADLCSDMTESDTISGCVNAIENDKAKL